MKNSGKFDKFTDLEKSSQNRKRIANLEKNWKLKNTNLNKVHAFKKKKKLK